MTVVASNYVRKENDLYQTEPWATEALLRNYPFSNSPKIWEPAAGNHLMADVLREAGAVVVTSDIATYDRPHDLTFDFLGAGLARVDFDGIITNPPYGKSNRTAVKFAERALERCAGFVALLLTAKFDSGKTRTHLFRDNPRFAAKIVLLDRIQWFEGDHGGTEDHCWLVWRPVGAPAAPPVILYEGREAHRMVWNDKEAIPSGWKFVSYVENTRTGWSVLIERMSAKEIKARGELA